ncbi:hypothetical protein BDV3_000475 [Batrachochytrium dendrobatidis]|nr:hypothetical protein QVD99_008065 [Batrachochytrium dendrobatidis]
MGAPLLKHSFVYLNGAITPPLPYSWASHYTKPRIGRVQFIQMVVHQIHSIAFSKAGIGWLKLTACHVTGVIHLSRPLTGCISFDANTLNN